MDNKPRRLNILYGLLKREIKEKSIKSFLEEKEKLNYSPNYQRLYVWNNTKAIKLIESVLINGEIPPITVFMHNDKIEIIDGRQRVETFIRFTNNEFTLNSYGLTKLRDLHKCKYGNIPENVRDIFDEYRMRIITYSTEENMSDEEIETIKRDLFRRYNYGMTALSKTDIERAKYLFDDLSNNFKDILEKDNELYEKIVSVYLAKTKRKINSYDKINLTLVNIREALALPYVPIIGHKSVEIGSAAIGKYYRLFVLNLSEEENFNEFFKVFEKVYHLKSRLEEGKNPLSDNILFLKSVHWMLSILYKIDKDKFKEFNVNSFYHYLTEDGDAINYYDNYKNLNSSHIINRHTYVNNYLENKINIDTTEYHESLYENRRIIVYKPTTDLRKVKIWNGIGTERQIISPKEPYPVKDIIDLINKDRFIIRPIFQRMEVKNEIKASKIIESILLGVKIPPIYVSIYRNADGRDNFAVIDGQQRLISILKYIGTPLKNGKDIINTKNNKYSLKGLKKLTDLNGKVFEVPNENAKYKQECLKEDLKKDILDYEIEFIKIDKQANPNLDPIDMFLRLNENPCPISNNSFEMWNSFDIIENIDYIKQLSRYDLFKQSGNKMKEAELVTILAYMDRKNIKLENVNDFLRIYLYTENKDKNEQRTEVKLSINNKSAITNYLENMKSNEKETIEFNNSIQNVEKFIDKLKILTNNDAQKLIKIFNPFINVAVKANMKDIYIIWLLLNEVEPHIIMTKKEQLLNDLEKLFKEMKNINETSSINDFLNYLKKINEKYLKINI